MKKKDVIPLTSSSLLSILSFLFFFQFFSLSLKGGTLLLFRHIFPVYWLLYWEIKLSMTLSSLKCLTLISVVQKLKYNLIRAVKYVTLKYNILKKEQFEDI